MKPKKPSRTRYLSRREMIRLTGVGTLGLIAASCTAAPPPAAPAPAPAEQKQEEPQPTAAPAETKHDITVAWHTGGESVNKIFAEAVTKFEDAHPDYTLNKIEAPWDQYMEKMLVMYASGNAPDAHTIPWGWYAVFAEKGGLLDIGPYAERDSAELKPDEMWPAAWDGMLYKGVRRALPRETMGMFLIAYNKDLFTSAGVPNPSELYEADQWDWGKWRETAKAMTILKGDRFEQVGGNFPVFSEGWDITMRSWGLEGGLYNEDLTEIRLTDDKTYDFTEWMQSVITEDKSIMRPGETQEFDWMASGKQAMVHDATWAVPNWRDTWKFEWDFAPPPKGEGGFFQPAGYDFYGCNAKTKDPDGAWEFIKFQNLPDMTLWWGEQMFGLPFHKSVSDKWIQSVSAKPPPSKGWTYIPAMAAASVGVVNTVAQNLYQNEWENKIIPVFRGDLVAEEVFPEVKAAIEKELAGT